MNFEFIFLRWNEFMYVTSDVFLLSYLKNGLANIIERIEYVSWLTFKYSILETMK